MTLAGKLFLGCIADDYTGASDLANTLTRQGLRTVQTIGVPSDDLALPDVDAVVVSLKSRSIAANVAVDRSRAAENVANNVRAMQPGQHAIAVANRAIDKGHMMHAVKRRDVGITVQRADF